MLDIHNINIKNYLNKRTIPLVVVLVAFIVFYIPTWKIVDIIATLIISFSLFFIATNLVRDDGIKINNKIQDTEEVILERGVHFKNQEQLNSFLKSKKRELDMFRWEKRIRLIIVVLLAILSLSTSIGIIFSI